MKNLFKQIGVISMVLIIGFSMAACSDGGPSGGGDVAKTIVITGLPAAYPDVAIALYPVGTTVNDVANETVDPVAASGVGMPGASVSTYPLYGMDDKPWTGSGSYAVYLVLKTSSNSRESKLYRASSVSFTAATTTVAFSQFTEIAGGIPNYSLDGVWGEGTPQRFTISGSEGIYNVFDSTWPLEMDAANRGYIHVGDQKIRNLTKTGDLTWSGQLRSLSYNTSNPNVCVGTTWTNVTFTLSNDGNTLTFYTPGTTTAGGGWNRVTSYSLDGVWEQGDGVRITVSGNTGVTSALGNLDDDPVTRDAISKGYFYIGNTHWRNLTSTGTLTWSGQINCPTYNTSNPTVCTGMAWVSGTFTMSATGQTLTFSSSSVNLTYTKVTTWSLDGIWEASWGAQVIVSGNSGVYSAFGTQNALWQDAISKGYLNIGEQEFHNLTSTGNLTWSGQKLGVTYNTSSPNVAIGKSWMNATFTLSADGQTLTVTGTSGSGPYTEIWTRKW